MYYNANSYATLLARLTAVFNPKYEDTSTLVLITILSIFWRQSKLARKFSRWLEHALNKLNAFGCAIKRQFK